MKFIKLHVGGDTIRWINLEQVSRVTLANESSGHQLMVIVFADGHRETQLRLSSEDDHEAKMIDQIIHRLDAWID